MKKQKVKVTDGLQEFEIEVGEGITDNTLQWAVYSMLAVELHPSRYGATPADWIGDAKENVEALLEAYRLWEPDTGEACSLPNVGSFRAPNNSIYLHEMRMLDELLHALDNFESSPNREFEAYTIGRLMAELEIRLQENPLRGLKAVLGGKKGTEAYHGNASEKAEVREKMRTAFDKFKESHPYHSKKNCCEEVGKQFNVGYKTVERAIKK